jgi:hypothetical protein
MGLNPIMGFELRKPPEKRIGNLNWKNHLGFQWLKSTRPVTQHWREFFCSITPSARHFPEPILRPQRALVRSAYFGFLGTEPLDSDKPSARRNVLSQAVLHSSILLAAM